MPFKTFNHWLFDGNLNSPIPRPDPEKDKEKKTPDILKYNSPITHTYVISLFVRNSKLTRFLDKYFNNINLRYLDKEELFKFVKTLVHDFRIRNSSFPFFKYSKQDTKLFQAIKRKFPLLKPYEVLLFCDLVDSSPEREIVYSSLGIDEQDVSKTNKRKHHKPPEEKERRVSINSFLSENFSTLERTVNNKKVFSIKQSFADCFSCPLLDSDSCILETNATYLDEIDVVFVAENPGKDEVEKRVPLIGRAGETFRKFFSKFKLNTVKYLLTNVVLCQTVKPDGTTGNPDDEVIERCKVNLFKILEECKNLKLVVVMGTSPMKAFGIKGSITQLRGELFKIDGRDVLLTVHPSFVNRQPTYKTKFEDDIKKVSEKLGILFSVEEEKQPSKQGVKGVFYYKIPEKFYTSDYRLVDVQFLRSSSQVLYIFRDKNNHKEYHKENDNYVCYQAPDSKVAKKIMKYEELEQVHIPYSRKANLRSDITYEGDLKITTKHAQDYYLQSKGEPEEFDLNIMFLDIEIYSEKKEFPNVEEANDPVVLISYYFKEKLKTYALDISAVIKKTDTKIEKKEDIEVVQSEKELLLKFISDVRSLEPDFICGWNVSRFDLAYLFYRSKKLGVSFSTISKFQEVEVDVKQGYVDIAGLNVVDQLILYRNFSDSLKENYRLGTIAQIELGETKLDVGASFSEKYEKDVNEAIEYNRRDVSLLVKLEDKLKHVSLQDEIRKVSRCNFTTSVGTLSTLDSLITSYLKEKGLSSKNAEIHEEDEEFEGAFVKEPLVGVHNHIVDLDFTSLYPRLIQTFNIGVNTYVMKFEDPKDGFDFVYQKENLPDKVRVVVNPVYSKQVQEVDKEVFLKKVSDSKLICTINGCFYLPHEREVSVYSEVLDFIMSARKKYKDIALEKEEEITKMKLEGKSSEIIQRVKSEKDLYDTRQKVYKILANAIYGVLGNRAFRFFETDCARSVTLSGQEMIKTSILEAENFVEFLRTKKKKKIVPLTKEEMFSEELNRETRNIITGDTDSLFVTYENIKENITLEDVDKWNSQLQDFLNNEVVPSVVEKHGVSREKSKLQLKNELVVSRGLFLAKKRYALHVVRREGKLIDEIQVKGLETRRSDYPSFSKKCISELLEVLLKSDKIQIKKLLSFVKEKEAIFIEKISMGEKDVARPCSWTSRLSDYKTVPQGVRAMQNWNSLVYPAHSVGSKGYLFKLHGIDLEKAPKEVVERYNQEFLSKGKKLDVIAIPDEEERLPEYFIPDVREMLQFSWKDRYELILGPLTKVEEDDKVLTF